MKDYRQFIIDTENDSRLAENIHSEIIKLADIYIDKTDRELLTIAAKAHGYDFSVLDVMNTQIVMKMSKLS